MAANSKYACSCGRTFSFESVLMRHCKQTGHEPATGPVEEQPRPVMASVQAAAEQAKQQAAAAAPAPAAPASPAPEPAPEPAPAPAPPPKTAPAPTPAPEPAPPPPKPAAPPPKPAAPPPQPAAPPAAEPAPVAAPPAPEPTAPVETAPETAAEGEAAPTTEEPLIYEAALRVLMAKQSAWQEAVPPLPPLKERLAQMFRPQLEQLDKAVSKVSTDVHQTRSKAAPYLSVIISVPIGLVLIWAGYRLAKALLTLP